MSGKVQPEVSIIIPTRDEASVIAWTLQHLQAARGFAEIIVSDGRSTDGTLAIAGPLADRVVTLPAGEEGDTIAAARNRGAAVAEGKILLFLDADVTTPDPQQFIRTMVDAFILWPNLVGVTAFLRVLPDRATFADRFFSDFINWLFLFTNVVGIGCAAGEVQAIRSEAFRAVGGFNPALVAGEDFDLFRRIARLGRTRTLRTLVVYHTGRRVHVVGWLHLLLLWARNAAAVVFLHRSLSRRWEEVR